MGFNRRHHPVPCALSPGRLEAMSTPISIPRTAPIPIAAKPNHAKNDTPAKESIKPKASSSMRSLIVDGDLPNTRTRKDRPCDACRRRKSKCVIHEGQVACVLCKFHKQDCTFVQSPQPRKRKLVAEEGKEDSGAKRRYVFLVFVPDTALKRDAPTCTHLHLPVFRLSKSGSC